VQWLIDKTFIQVMQPFKNILDYINICATDQQPNKMFKFLRSHSLDITSYATKLPEKKERKMLKTGQSVLRLPVFCA